MQKIYKKAILFFAFLLFAIHSFSQDINTDTTLANEYYNLAKKYHDSYLLDSAKYYLKNSQLLYTKHLGENSLKNANILLLKGNICYYGALYEDALNSYQKSLTILQNFCGENNDKAANLYNNIGAINQSLANYNEAQKYFLKALIIREKLFGELNQSVAASYNNLGTIYLIKSDIKNALKYLEKGLKILLQLNKEESHNVAMIYINIGICYKERDEIDLAIEYYQKSLAIISKLYGKDNSIAALIYNNIGLAYQTKHLYDLALLYLFKSIDIKKLQIGTEIHNDIANAYGNIGSVYKAMGNNNEALKFYLKDVEILKNIYTDTHQDLAMVYHNIGNIYKEKQQYEEALYYYFLSIQMREQLFGDKNKYIAKSYKNIAELYYVKNQINNSLFYNQKAIYSCINGFVDTTNYLTVPSIKNVNDWGELIEVIRAKAIILNNNNNKKNIVLRHYQACDTLINQVRKEITMLSDKIALGEKANQVYNEAVEVCLKLSKVAPNDSVDYYKKLAFEYSEKNKSSVLLESLAGAQAMQFSGIPDSLLEKEHNLQIDIALYKRLFSEQPDSAQEVSFRNRLFKANRNYEELIRQFEKSYPEYYNLKYGQNLANVNQLQQTLDKATAIISYQETDSVLFIFYIEKNNYQIYTTAKRSNYQEIINVFRQSLVNTAPNNPGLYKAAHFLYKQLFPFNIESHIQNLIIIPEGNMCLIPFEALLTEEYKGNPEQYNNYAYLLKKYNISYAYSANLFYRTFPKKPTKKIEVTQLNDWLAMAPVFDDVKTGGASFRTRQLLRAMEKIKTDTITTRAFMLTGEYITPLPGTEQEVKNIFNKFENKNKKALVQLNANANETFIKSEELKNYKYLHFASHGIVNMQKPELSGIILAQDSASGEDGILYSGEIYNLKLNADLTVLSACETGLGEIKKGEGLIGLTRALLYAGSKNIIVSLWKVADNSTSQLMVDFYDILLKDEKNTTNYSSALRQAKIKMISEGKYSHPFYWSPFILVGK